MRLSDKEVKQINKLLSEIESGLQKKSTTTIVRTRVRRIRLIFTKSLRRDKNTLFEL